MVSESEMEAMAITMSMDALKILYIDFMYYVLAKIGRFCSLKLLYVEVVVYSTIYCPSYGHYITD